MSSLFCANYCWILFWHKSIDALLWYNNHRACRIYGTLCCWNQNLSEAGIFPNINTTPPSPLCISIGYIQSCTLQLAHKVWPTFRVAKVSLWPRSERPVLDSKGLSKTYFYSHSNNTVKKKIKNTNHMYTIGQIDCNISQLCFICCLILEPKCWCLYILNGYFNCLSSYFQVFVY